MVHENKLHLINNHPKNSQVHAYSFEGEYLGHVKDIVLFMEHHFDAMLTHEAYHIVYNRDNCTHILYMNNKVHQVYEVVVTQNLIILGYRKVL